MKKTVVVTGCSSGIGLYCAGFLAKKEYNVIATVRRVEDVAKVQEEGVEHVLVMDLADSESIKAAVKEIVQISNGDIFALFNNAAYGQPGAVEDLTRATLREQFETNLFGTHELTCELLPYLLQQDAARIIQNSSVLGFAAMPMRGAYNASKFALEGLTDTLRQELKASSNIKVILIEPGPILSNFRKNALKAMERNIDVEKSRHKDLYKNALERLNRKGANSSFTLGPDAVAEKLLKALEAKHPKARYYVTVPTHLFAFLRHILPTSWLDKVLTASAKA